MTAAVPACCSGNHAFYSGQLLFLVRNNLFEFINRNSVYRLFAAVLFPVCLNNDQDLSNRYLQLFPNYLEDSRMIFLHNKSSFCFRGHLAAIKGKRSGICEYRALAETRAFSTPDGSCCKTVQGVVKLSELHVGSFFFNSGTNSFHW